MTAPRTGQLGATSISPTVVVLAAVNVAVYAVSRADPLSAYARFAMVPELVHQGQWYRLLTAAFLHVSVEHVAFNMVTLLIIGSPVEALVGRVRFVAIYLVAGLGGSVCSYLVSRPDIEGIGASGAIFGLFGAYVVLARSRRFDLRTVSALIAIELVLSFVEPGIDWRAHVGGLVVGAGLTAALVAVGRRPTRATALREVAVTLALLAILMCLVLLPPGHVDL